MSQNRPPDLEFAAGEYSRDPELDEARYLPGDAAAAAGLSMPVLKAWVSREPVVIRFGPHDRQPLGKGSARVFTLRRVLCLAFTAELVRLGLKPSSAGAVAYAYTDSDRSQLKLSDDVFLVVFPGDETDDKGLHFNFVPSDSKVSLQEMLARDSAPVADPATSCAVVDCAAIKRRVMKQLASRGR